MPENRPRPPPDQPRSVHPTRSNQADQVATERPGLAATFHVGGRSDVTADFSGAAARCRGAQPVMRYAHQVPVVVSGAPRSSALMIGKRGGWLGAVGLRRASLDDCCRHGGVACPPKCARDQPVLAPPAGLPSPRDRQCEANADQPPAGLPVGGSGRSTSWRVRPGCRTRRCARGRGRSTAGTGRRVCPRANRCNRCPTTTGSSWRSWAGQCGWSG